MQPQADGSIRVILEQVAPNAETGSLAVHNRVVSHHQSIVFKTVGLNDSIVGILVDKHLIQEPLLENRVSEPEAVCSGHKNTPGSDSFENAVPDNNGVGLH